MYLQSKATDKFILELVRGEFFICSASDWMAVMHWLCVILWYNVIVFLHAISRALLGQSGLTFLTRHADFLTLSPAFPNTPGFTRPTPKTRPRILLDLQFHSPPDPLNHPRTVPTPLLFNQPLP
jgi:hypothetical protein